MMYLPWDESEEGQAIECVVAIASSSNSQRFHQTDCGSSVFSPLPSSSRHTGDVGDRSNVQPIQILCHHGMDVT